MTIPHIEERKKLLALYEQAEQIAREERQVVGPLQAAANAKWQEVIEEYKAAGGKWPGGVKDHMAIMPLEVKCEPARKAVADAARPFKARMDAVDAEIDKITEKVGTIRDDAWNGEGHAFCAMTGLPILESDRVGSVIASALPVTASINQTQQE